MSGHRYDDRLSEIDDRTVTDAEADLDRLLSIEPSAEFVAKVRAKIDAERARPSGWMVGWRWALAFASLAAVGIAIAFAFRAEPSQLPRSVPVVVETRPTPRPTEPPVAGSEKRKAVSEERGAASGQRAAGSRQQGAGEPEVLVPPDQRIALQRALALSTTGALDERMFTTPPMPAAAGADAPTVPPIVVEDVVVTPISAAGGIEKGFGQIQ